MQAYLFVHFRERRTPDGEQVYFGLSRDGFRWEAVNSGQPVLWSRPILVPMIHLSRAWNMSWRS